MKEDLKGEVWRDVIGYEGIYQVSNMGRVYSMPRNMTGVKNCIRKNRGNIINGSRSSGYYTVRLFKNGSSEFVKIHQLVAINFLNHERCGHQLVIDHINDNKLDNRLENLQVVTQRFNVGKTKKENSTSKYKGVCWCKQNNKYKANIKINGKTVHLGLFECEMAAHLAYKNKIKQIEL
jgi:hypothetical protein